MYAILAIDHRPGIVRDLLPGAMNAIHDPELLANSQYPGAHELPLDAPALFAGQTLTWQVICFAFEGQLQVIVEAREGTSLKAACQEVWGLLRQTIGPFQPRLRYLERIDPRDSEPVDSATTGLRPQLARPEIQFGLYPGLLTMAVIAVVGLSGIVDGHRLGEILIGGAPAVLATIVAFSLAAKAAYSRILVWQTR